MRLTCPNCGAEYEVPDGLVPEDGRHVQCTSCQTRWYVYGGARAIPSQDQIIHRLEQWRPGGGPPTGPRRAPEPEPERTGEAGASDDPAPSAAAPPEEAPGASPAADDAGAEKPAAAPEPPPPAKPTATPAPEAEDPEIAAIIALKRARDREGREPPAAAPPQRPDGGAAPARPTPSEEPPAAVAARVRQSPRMELPNSETMPRAIWADSPEELQARYRTGLFLALLLYALALAAYFWSDDLARVAPGIGRVLEGYAAGVDGLRVWLSELISALFGDGAQ